MDLLNDSWIPVRATSGSGSFRLLTLEELLCHEGDWRISLPRDDLELACTQLLVCLLQITFLPEDNRALLERLNKSLSPEAMADAIRPCQDWFQLDHPTQPFMQTRGVKAADVTPMQKLLIGLPEGNNHAFFNEVGEVQKVGPSIAAIVLFNQASNCPSFGGGFKGSLRGGAPVTTLVMGGNLRETLWRNVLTLPRIRERLPDYEWDLSRDRPTWIKPIREKEVIRAHEIGLARGLFWQPARVELVKANEEAACDVIGVSRQPVYTGFRKSKFTFNLEGLWPHPHGVQIWDKAKKEWKFVSFTTTAPAWTLLTEFVIPRGVEDANAKEGCAPAGPVVQASDIFREEPLYLLVGGYRTKQASVLERRHELFTLAAGWDADGKGRLKRLVDVGRQAKTALRGKLYFAAQGSKEKGMKGIGAAIHETGEKLYYARTEVLFHETLREDMTFKDWKQARRTFSERIVKTCHRIFDELTNPYCQKPELIPIIAWARRTLDNDLSKLTESIEP